MSEAERASALPQDGARKWWDSVCHPEHGNSGARAKLCRARTSIEALVVPEAIRLAKMLGAVGERSTAMDLRFEDAINLARVLAHIRVDADTHPMRAVGWPKFPGESAGREGEERPKLSEQRFRRLLQTESREDRVDAFTRLIALLGEKANVSEIARAFRYWNDEQGNTKRSWAFEYFDAARAAPASITTTTGEDTEA